MKIFKNTIPAAIVVVILFLNPADVFATMTWEITDGDPYYYMSDAIVVRNALETFDRTLVTPPGLVWQDPIVGQTNYVWVRVWRFGPLEPPPNDIQTGKSRLFIGHAGTLFEAANYNNYNIGGSLYLLDPPELPNWSKSEWDQNLTGSVVVPVRYQVTPSNWSNEYALDKYSTDLPDEGNCIWLLFELESYRLPSTASSVESPFSLVAYVYDPDYDDGGDVTTNRAMAERRFNVQYDTDGDGVGDNDDAFPNDPGETTDTDGDGVGDNSDAFPTDPAETVDCDHDGIGDNADVSKFCMPATLNYQGYLTDNSGNEVNDTVTITFRLYDVETGGTPHWESSIPVNVSYGVYSVILGENKAISPAMFSKQLYLGVQVAGEASEMVPRHKLAGVPYAMKAGSLVDGATLNYMSYKPGPAPSNPAEGDIYFDSSDAFCVYMVGGWIKLAGTGYCGTP